MLYQDTNFLSTLGRFSVTTNEIVPEAKEAYSRLNTSLSAFDPTGRLNSEHREIGKCIEQLNMCTDRDIRMCVPLAVGWCRPL